ncbi:MAG: hypothetical protein AAF693_17370 [Bacteroidota bacterium]
MTHSLHISNRVKIVILWLMLAISWLIHHLYGLFNIYYNETLIIEGATGEAPVLHHIYRILFEGMAYCFAVLTVEISASFFKWLTFSWAVLSALYDVYHVAMAVIYEPSNVSEIFILLLAVVANVFLVRALYAWIYHRG